MTSIRLAAKGGTHLVVIDTNLVLSALVFAQERLKPLRQAWETKRIQPLVFRETTAELMRVLAYPKLKLTANDQGELLADYLPFCKTVNIPSPPPKTPVCRDPFDRPLLQLAVAGKAAALVTGDRGLLSLAATFFCPIISADQFMKTWIA